MRSAAIFRGRKDELLFIRGGVFTGFFGLQNVAATSAQVNGQAAHDMTVEVKPNLSALQAPPNWEWACSSSARSAEDFVVMVEEVARRVEHLGFGDAQVLGDLYDRFTAPVQRGDVANGNPQPVNNGLAAANAIEANDVGMLRLDALGHPFDSGVKAVTPPQASSPERWRQPDRQLFAVVAKMPLELAEGFVLLVADAGDRQIHLVADLGDGPAPHPELDDTILAIAEHGFAGGLEDFTELKALRSRSSRSDAGVENPSSG